MPCVAPYFAFKASADAESQRPRIVAPLRDFDVDRADEILAAPSNLFDLLLPCGSCVGCQISRAREWAIRCTLEQQLHPVVSFVTLTYAEKYCPPTLSKAHLSLFCRYLRRDIGKFRFFGCGEYGGRTERPHYHAILFGTDNREAVQQAWGRGFATLEPVTPARISYTAGYCAKKLGFHRPKGEEIDYETGEVYTHQPPFLQMSRGPGIGGEFRRYWRSWRTTAIWQGRAFPVPRFLHASYKEHASDSEKAALELEKLESQQLVTVRELVAAELIAKARVRLKAERAVL